MVNVKIETMRDVINALQNHPELAEMFRAAIISRDMLELPQAVARLEAEVHEVRQKLDGHIADTHARFERVEEKLDGHIADTRAQFEKVNSRLGNLEGAGYERNAARQAVARAGILWGIENAELAFSQEDPPQPSFNRLIHRAYREGKLDQEQMDDLLRADAIITGENGAGAVAEVSLKPDRDDAARARRRATVLQALTGGNVQAVVVAPEFPADYAERNGVEPMEFRGKRVPA